MELFLQRTWAKIHLDRMAHNIREIRGRLRPGCKLMSVIKADGYGHGDEFTARLMEKCGVDWFGVSNIEEGLSLRKLGIQKPILIFGVTPASMAGCLAQQNMTQAIFSLEYAQSLSAAARSAGVKVQSHLKLDTGMGRIGFPCEEPTFCEAVDQMCCAAALPGLEITGAFTHFSVADELSPSSVDYTKAQFDRFVRSCGMLEERGISLPLKHCCNSAGMLQYPAFQLDMVRPGIIQYGLYPSEEIRQSVSIDLRPAMELKTVISQVKTIRPGDSVSYGRIYTASRETTIATVAIGYADGYHRQLSNNAYMLVRGRQAPVVGRICMDQLMLDVTGIEGVMAGDVVTVFGQDGEALLPVEEIARRVGTINYEIVCNIGRRVPRAYYQGEECVGVVDYLEYVQDGRDVTKL